ncbi:MAG TPA: phage holin family protein [Propionibacterium sp.]|jgi:putative membrane protein|nr:phage holin family protein [Propionibacterium sp.]
MRTLLQIVATALAVAVAAWLIPGIVVEGTTFASQAITLLIVAVIIGVLNAVVRPVLKFLTGCLIALTLGLFVLVVNAWILMLASWVSGLAGLGFHVNGFWNALFGSIIISLVTMLLSGITDKRRASA